MYPRALFVGKVDPDAYIVWPRLRSLLEAAHSSRGRTQLLVGYLEWVSYLPDEGRFCGCCGYSRAHGAKLQLARGANFGACAARPDGLSRVAGPFAYPQALHIVHYTVHYMVHHIRARLRTRRCITLCIASCIASCIT